jgi:hypothetical protein
VRSESQRLQHTIAFADGATSGCHWQLACQCVCMPDGSGHGRTSRPWHPAKPAGVLGAEIWGSVAWASRPRSCDPPPVDPSELSFLSVDTRTPYVANFSGEEP